MPVPSRVPIDHYRGDTLAVLCRLWADKAKTQPVDLTGTVVTAQVRLTPDSSAAIANFDVTVDGTFNNEIVLVLPPTATATLPPKACYDTQIDWDGTGTQIQTILAGDLTITADVTRAVG